MSEFDKKILNEFLEIVRKEIKNKHITDYDVMNPSEETREETYDAFLRILDDHARILSENFLETEENFMEQEEYCDNVLSNMESMAYRICTETLQSVLVEIMFTKKNEKLLNSIIRNSIDDVIYTFSQDRDFGIAVISVYLQYLINITTGALDLNKKREIFGNYTFIFNLDENKGYTTLADYIRDILVGIYYDAVSSEIDEKGKSENYERMTEALDEFFFTNEKNEYFIRSRKFSIRILFADAYLDLKINKIKCIDDEDNDLLEYIEELMNLEGPFRLPKDKNTRMRLYKHFANYNVERDWYRKEDMESLEDEEDIKRLLYINPLHCSTKIEVTFMTLFDRKMLNNYFEILKKKYGQSIFEIEKLLSPENEVITLFAESFVDTMAKHSYEIAIKMMEDEEEFEENNDSELKSKIIENQFDICVVTLQRVLTYIKLRGKKEDENFYNDIVKSDIEDTCSQLTYNSKFINKAMEYYIKYLVSISLCLITSFEETEFFNQNLLIENLDINKGYETISDIIRMVLMELFNDFMHPKNYYGEVEEINISDEELWENMCRIIDEFLTSEIRDVYLKQNDIDINDKAFVRKIKNYAVRVLLADAYLDFMIVEKDEVLGEYEEPLTAKEEEAIEYLNNCTRYELPNESLIRTEIYRHFFYYNENHNLDRKKDLNYIDDKSKAHAIMKIDPFIVL